MMKKIYFSFFIACLTVGFIQANKIRETLWLGWCETVAQARGISFCERCLDDEQNPTERDVQVCFERWLESEDFKTALRIACVNDSLCGNAFHEGNRLLEKRIRTIIKDNFKAH